MISEQKTFSVLARPSWGVTIQLHYVGHVRWITKQNTHHHPFGWEVRATTWLAGGSKDTVMRASTKGGRHYLWVCGNPGVISQNRGMIYGAHAGVGSEACIQFCLLRLEPKREASEMPMSGCHESPVGHMHLTAGPEATSSGANEQEIEYEPRLPFI